MPDLRKLLFFSRTKDYVDVTHPPEQKRKVVVSKRKKTSLKPRPKLLKIKIKKIKLPKAATRRKVFKVVLPSKKSPKLKPVSKPFVKAKPVPKIPKEMLVGEVTHFFDKIKVCVIKLKKQVKIGDKLHFVGKENDFFQPIDSMQINHEQVVAAKKNDEIGLKVIREVRPGDKVFLP